MSTSNASRKETERTKLMQDKCQTLLTQMLRDDDNKYCVDCDAKGKYAYKHTNNMHLKWIFVHTHKHARICTTIVFVVGGGASDPLSFKAHAWINLGFKKGSTHIKLAYINLGRQYIHYTNKRKFKMFSPCGLCDAL